MKRYLCATIIVVLNLMVIATLSATPMMTQGDVSNEWGFQRVTLVEGLEHPWSMAWLPGGEILVTERPGRLRVVRSGQLDPRPVGGVPKVFDSGQGGLLDISIHPKFKDNQKLYFTFASGTTMANRTCVATAEWDNGRLKNWQIIFQVTDDKVGGQHFGSRLLWLPDETLLISVGDGGNPPVRMDGDWIRKQAQNRRTHLGKILRIKSDGSVPADNPFADSPDAAAAVWSYGHRNVQGLAYDADRSTVWASEHGALGGDELNQIQPGRNYGWPDVTFSREYHDGSKISPDTSRSGMTDPEVVWMSAIAPSGLMFYSANRFEQWQGDLFVGGLRSQDIRRIDLDGDGRSAGQTALRIGQRVRDVRQGPDGLIYVLTDESNGSLIRLEPSDNTATPQDP